MKLKEKIINLFIESRIAPGTKGAMEAADSVVNGVKKVARSNIIDMLKRMAARKRS